MKHLVAAFIVMFSVSGCGLFGGGGSGGTTTPPDPATVESKVQIVTQTAIVVALKTLPQNRVVQLTTDLKTVSSVIEKDIEPFFMGASVNTLTVQIADDVLARLKSQLPADVSVYITTGIGLISALVPIPKSPEASIPPAVSADILAALQGIDNAIAQALNLPAPPAPVAPPTPPKPPAPPPPTARMSEPLWAHVKSN